MTLYLAIVTTLTLAILALVILKGRRYMSEIDDIKAGLAQLATAVTTVASDLTAIEAQIPAAGTENVQTADLDAIKLGITNAVAALNAAAASVAPAAPAAGGGA